MNHQRHANRNRQQDKTGNGKVKDNKKKGGKVVKEKFHQDIIDSFPPLTAKTENQKRALRAMKDKQFIVLCGSAGSGKTTLAVWWACNQYNKGNIDNIVFMRGEKGLGATPPVPGNDTEKMLTHCLPMLLKTKEFLGAGVLKNKLCMQDIDFLFNDVKGFMVFPMAKLGGISFDERTIVICDETQAATVAQVKALATRPEGGCQVIVCGDTTQTPIKGSEDGLSYLERKMMEHPYHDSAIIKFSPEDNQRKGWTKHITEVFEKDGIW